MGLTGTHQDGDPGRLSDDNLRDTTLNQHAASIATLTSDVAARVTSTAVATQIAGKLDTTVANNTFVSAVVVAPSATSGTAVQAAITALGAAGGDIVLAKGAHTWDSVPKLPRALTGRLTIRGAAGSNVTLTSGAPRMFDLDWTADHQTFQHISLLDLSVDAGHFGGRHHVLVGRYVNGAFTGRFNLDDWHVARCRVYNILTDSNIGTNHRIGIHLVTSHGASGEATQNTSTNLRFDDITIEGGNAGILTGANGGTTGVNVWCDNHTLTRCKFVGEVVPTAFYASSGFQLGQSSFGGTARITDCTSINTGDNGFEVNAWDDARLTNCLVQDAWNVGYYAKNFHPARDAATQLITYDNCRNVVSAMTPATSSNGRGFGLMDTAAANPFGKIIYNNCEVRVDNPGAFAAAGYAVLVSQTPIQAIVLNNFRVTIQNIAVNPAATISPSAFHLNPTGTCKTSGDVTINAYGTKSGANTCSFRGFNLDGTDHEVDLRVTCDINVTGMTTNGIYLFNIAEQASCKVGGRVHVNVIRLGTDAGPRGFRFRSNSAQIRDQFVISGNFAGMAGGVEVLVDDAALKPKIQIRDIAWKTAPAISTKTVGASPYSYQNVSMYPESVTVTANGATVSQIETIWKPGATAVTTGMIAGQFVIQNGGTITVSYTGGPPIVKATPAI